MRSIGAHLRIGTSKNWNAGASFTSVKHAPPEKKKPLSALPFNSNVNSYCVACSAVLCSLCTSTSLIRAKNKRNEKENTHNSRVYLLSLVCVCMAFTFSYSAFHRMNDCAQAKWPDCVCTIQITGFVKYTQSSSVPVLAVAVVVRLDKVSSTWQKRFKANFSYRTRAKKKIIPTLIDGHSDADRHMEDLQSSKSHIDYFIFIYHGTMGALGAF